MVELPGVSDVARAKEIISNTALLELKLVEAGPAPDQADAPASRTTARCPTTWKWCPARRRSAADRRRPRSTWCSKVAAITGRDLRNARPTIDEYNAPASASRSTARAWRSSAASPAANVGRQLAIVLDGRVVSAPRDRRRRSVRRRADHRAVHASRRHRTSRSCCDRARCRLR